MRIGLLRHFPVARAFPVGWRTVSELQQWRESYERTEVVVGDFDAGGIEWQDCLASDLPRARVTASVVFGGTVEHWAMLREVEFAEFRTGGLRLPVQVWKWVYQLSWLTGHPSQRRHRDEFRARVREVADRLSALERDTLVVSHAGMMAYLSRELRRRGFIGPRVPYARHARAYVFERGR